MEDLISIIVPVYNVENFLNECIESIIKQSYKNIEIILVDDGSTDTSGAICDELSQKDNRIKVFHKKNGGLSDARNYGIKKAAGNYIMFVDSDDIISENIVFLLFQAIDKSNSDVSVCNLMHFQDGDLPLFSDVKNVKDLSGQESLEDLLYQRLISTSSCAKLYKKESINDIAFVKGQRFEDNEFLFKVFNSVNKVTYINANLYGYRHRKKSITTDIFSEKDFDIINIGKKILNEIKDENIKKAAIVYQCTNAFRIYLTASDEYLDDERFLYCKKFLDENVGKIIKNKKVRIKQKIASILYILKIPRKLLIKIREKKGRW